MRAHASEIMVWSRDISSLMSLRERSWFTSFGLAAFNSSGAFSKGVLLLFGHEHIQSSERSQRSLGTAFALNQKWKTVWQH
jgi:hypothetical protein